MRRRSVRGATALALALAAAVFCSAGAAAPPAPTSAVASDTTPAPVHDDPEALVDAALDVVRALWAEDGSAATVALGRLEPRTRILDEAGDERFGDDPVAYSRAMRTTIDRTREELLRPDYEQAFNMFVWTQRSCMGCHAAVREAGLSAPSAPPR